MAANAAATAAAAVTARALRPKQLEFARAGLPTVAGSACCGRRGAASSASADSEVPPFLRKKGFQPARTREGIPLPPGWREERSRSRGVYFAHEATGVVQWDLPRGPPSKEQVAEAHKERHGQQVSQLHPGAKVQLIGLKFAPQLNGKTGTCDRWETDGSGMVRVRLASGELKAVKPENLLVIQAAAPRLQPQRLIPGPPSDTGSAGGTWASKWWVLGALGGGALAVWALSYWRYQAELRAREEERARKRAEAAALAAHEAELRKEAEASAAANSPAPSPAPAAQAQAQASAPPPLPEGWRETLDAATGRPYYWKEADPANSVTWERPASSSPAAAPSAPPSAGA